MLKFLNWRSFFLEDYSIDYSIAWITVGLDNVLKKEKELTTFQRKKFLQLFPRDFYEIFQDCFRNIWF